MPSLTGKLVTFNEQRHRTKRELLRNDVARSTGKIRGGAQKKKKAKSDDRAEREYVKTDRQKKGGVGDLCERKKKQEERGGGMEYLLVGKSKKGRGDPELGGRLWKETRGKKK